MNISEHPQLSTQFYRAIIDQAPDAILIMDLKWQVLETNQPAQLQLAYSRDELQNLNFYQIENGFSPEQAGEYIDILKNRGTLSFISKKIRKDGSLFSTETRLSLLTDQDKPMLLAFIRQVPQASSSEIAPKKEKALMDNIPDSIYFKDRECRLIRVNKKLRRDLGATSEKELLGKMDIDLFGEEFGQETMTIDREIIRTGS